jgi:hypothetical protein
VSSGARSSGPDPAAVCLAFSTGWNISELYQLRKLPSTQAGIAKVTEEQPDELPELAELPAWQRARLVEAQIMAATSELNLDDLPLPFDWNELGKDRPRETLRAKVLELHEQLTYRFFATDPSAERAYRLGVALAHTVLVIRRPLQRPYSEVLKSGRVYTIDEWLDALRSQLPRYSANAVKFTLREWQQWAAAQDPAASGDKVANERLRRQGEVWRSLLSGERAPEEMLQPANYIKAASNMLKGILQLAAGALWSPVGVLGGLLLLAVSVFGFWLILSSHDLGRFITGGLAVLAVAGVAAGSVGAGAKRTVAAVQEPLWKAILGEAVSMAALIKPVTDQERDILSESDLPADEEEEPTSGADRAG